MIPLCSESALRLAAAVLARKRLDRLGLEQRKTLLVAADLMSDIVDESA
jgi:hypothetical protein